MSEIYNNKPTMEPKYNPSPQETISQDGGVTLPDRAKNIDILLMLSAVLSVSVYYHGVRVLLMALYAIIFSVLSDYLSLRIKGRKNFFKWDFSPIITALIFVSLLPASAPYWLVIFGVMFANLVVKLPFGGYGNNLFNPTAVAAAFVAICWGDKMFLYPAPLSNLPLASDITENLTHGLAYNLNFSAIPNLSPLDLLLGNFSGPLGSCGILICLVCAVYLLIRRTIHWQTVLTSLFSFCSVILIVNIYSANLLSVVMCELVSGAFLFGTVFMASDPVTSPKTGWGRMFYGVFLGGAVMLFRLNGQTELAFVYALILTNAVSPVCDRLGASIFSFKVKEKTNV